MRSYEAARSLFSFLGFIAWSVVVLGVLVALVSAAGGSRFGGAGAGLLAMVPGVAIGIAGFILVAFVQMGRATVDTAEYTQQMLKIARDQLDVSKQGLNQGKVLEQGFAALKSAPEERPAASFADATSDASPTKASNSQSKLKLVPASKSVETIEYTRISQVSSIFSAARRRFCYKNHEVVAYMERRIWHTRWVNRNRGAFGSFLTVD